MAVDQNNLRVLLEELARELPDCLLDTSFTENNLDNTKQSVGNSSKICKRSPVHRARTEILAIASDVARCNGGRFEESNDDTTILKAAPPMDDADSHLTNLGSFFVAISECLTILYTSRNVHRLTPFSQPELIGHRLLEFVDAKDHKKVENYLGRKRNGLLDAQSKESGTRQFFHFRLRNVFSQYVSMMGRYRRFGRRFVFLGVIRPVRDRAITELSLMEAVQDQYITRHLPDGKIIFADHRISTICGYLPSELVGMSGFNFIMGEDLPFTTMAQRHMFANTSGEGFTTYRLRRKDGEYIFVQTRGYLEISPETQKVDSFMCINTLVKEGDGPRFLEQQRARFTPYIARYHKEIVQEDREKLLALFPETKTLLAPTMLEENSEPPRKRLKSSDSQEEQESPNSSNSGSF